MSELWQLGVVELIEQLRTRELDSAEVARAFAARAHEVDRELNCFVALTEAPALRRDGPLRGIPYAYKDVFTHAGVAPGLGLRRPERRSGVGDAAVLVRLEAQGAVALGRLQLDPLAYSTIGLNPLLGDVRNPWAPERIAGGSSSGAAAAAAATVTRTEAAALYAHELDVAPPVLRSRLEDAVASGGDGYVDALRYQPR